MAKGKLAGEMPLNCIWNIVGKHYPFIGDISNASKTERFIMFSSFKTEIKRLTLGHAGLMKDFVAGFCCVHTQLASVVG